MTPRSSRWRVVLRGGEEEEEPGRNTRANPSKLSGRPIERRALPRSANHNEEVGLIFARNQWGAPNGAERRTAGAMTDLYSGLGGGPAPERRREEGRPPPPPSWTGPVQLPWSRRQPLPGLSLIPESPTRSSRTIPGPLPLSTTQPYFRLSRPLIAIAPGLGARGKRKKKKKKGGGRALASLSPLLACRDTLRSGGASSCGERQVRLGRTPFPLPSAPSADFLLRDPAACRDTASAPAGPKPRARAQLRLGRAGTLSSLCPPASGLPRGRAPAPGARCPSSSASGWAWSGGRAAGRGGVFLLWARGPLLQSCLPRELHSGALPQCTRKLQLVGVLIGGSLFGRDGSCGGKSPQDPRVQLTL